MNKLFEIKVNLSERQINRIIKANIRGKTIIIRFSKDSLNGYNTLYVLEGTKLELEYERIKGKRGMDIKIFPMIDIEEREDGFHLLY